MISKSDWEQRHERELDKQSDLVNRWAEQITTLEQALEIAQEHYDTAFETYGAMESYTYEDEHQEVAYQTWKDNR